VRAQEEAVAVESPVAYQAEINRSHPSAFLFLIDQSGSMSDPWGGASGTSKADRLADILNRLLQNLVLRCAKTEGVRDYYSVGVLGYGQRVRPAFAGALGGRELIAISEVADNPARIEERTRKVEDGAGGLVDQTVRFPIWFDPIANLGTPMCEALSRAREILEPWVRQHPASFPPVVINISDGESTDGDPSAAAADLRSLATDDGNVLLFNVHLSALSAEPVAFPHAPDGLADRYARLLFEMSSPLTSFMLGVARQEGFEVAQGARGFVFNADPVTVIQFLDIGTRPSNLR
jgi:hypothetical protein